MLGRKSQYESRIGHIQPLLVNTRFEGDDAIVEEQLCKAGIGIKKT